MIYSEILGFIAVLVKNQSKIWQVSSEWSVLGFFTQFV